MASTSPRREAVVCDGKHDAPGPPGTLGARNMHDTVESIDEHDTKSATEKMDNQSTAMHDMTASMLAVLDTVSRLATSSCQYSLLILYQSELLELILSRLSTKDLTRALTVSKHWQKSILGSVVLRRNLFIEAAPKQEYLNYSQGQMGEWAPSIAHEPNKNSKTIVELHPILLPHSNPRAKASIEIGSVSYEVLHTVQPSTLLFQPPLERIGMRCLTPRMKLVGDTELERTHGVTFGTVLEAMVSVRGHHGDDGCVGFEGVELFSLFILGGVVARNARMVREALAQAHSSTNLEKFKPEQAL